MKHTRRTETGGRARAVEVGVESVETERGSDWVENKENVQEERRDGTRERRFSLVSNTYRFESLVARYRSIERTRAAESRAMDSRGTESNSIH